MRASRKGIVFIAVCLLLLGMAGTSRAYDPLTSRQDFKTRVGNLLDKKAEDQISTNLYVYRCFTNRAAELGKVLLGKDYMDAVNRGAAVVYKCQTADDDVVEAGLSQACEEIFDIAINKAIDKILPEATVNAVIAPIGIMKDIILAEFASLVSGCDDVNVKNTLDCFVQLQAEEGGENLSAEEAADRLFGQSEGFNKICQRIAAAERDADALEFLNEQILNPNSQDDTEGNAKLQREIGLELAGYLQQRYRAMLAKQEARAQQADAKVQAALKASMQRYNTAVKRVRADFGELYWYKKNPEAFPICMQYLWKWWSGGEGSEEARTRYVNYLEKVKLWSVTEEQADLARAGKAADLTAVGSRAVTVPYTPGKASSALAQLHALFEKNFGAFTGQVATIASGCYSYPGIDRLAEQCGITRAALENYMATSLKRSIPIQSYTVALTKGRCVTHAYFTNYDRKEDVPARIERAQALLEKGDAYLRQQEADYVSGDNGFYLMKYASSSSTSSSASGSPPTLSAPSKGWSNENSDVQTGGLPEGASSENTDVQVGGLPEGASATNEDVQYGGLPSGATRFNPDVMPLTAVPGVYLGSNPDVSYGKNPACEYGGSGGASAANVRAALDAAEFIDLDARLKEYDNEFGRALDQATDAERKKIVAFLAQSEEGLTELLKSIKSLAAVNEGEVAGVIVIADNGTVSVSDALRNLLDQAKDQQLFGIAAMESLRQYLVEKTEVDALRTSVGVLIKNATTAQAQDPATFQKMVGASIEILSGLQSLLRQYEEPIAKLAAGTAKGADPTALQQTIEDYVTTCGGLYELRITLDRAQNGSYTPTYVHGLTAAQQSANPNATGAISPDQVPAALTKRVNQILSYQKTAQAIEGLSDMASRLQVADYELSLALDTLRNLKGDDAAPSEKQLAALMDAVLDDQASEDKVIDAALTACGTRLQALLQRMATSQCLPTGMTRASAAALAGVSAAPAPTAAAAAGITSDYEAYTATIAALQKAVMAAQKKQSLLSLKLDQFHDYFIGNGVTALSLSSELLARLKAQSSSSDDVFRSCGDLINTSLVAWQKQQAEQEAVLEQMKRLVAQATAGRGADLVAAVGSAESAIRATLDDMEAAYEAENVSGFMRHVSSSFKASVGNARTYTQLQESIYYDFRNLRNIRFDMRVEDISQNASNSKLYVVPVRWTRYAEVEQSGDQWRLGDQTTVFTFDLSNPSSPLLVNVQGDVPFGLANPYGTITISKGYYNNNAVTTNITVENGKRRAGGTIRTGSSSTADLGTKSFKFSSGSLVTYASGDFYYNGGVGGPAAVGVSDDGASGGIRRLTGYSSLSEAIAPTSGYSGFTTTFAVGDIFAIRCIDGSHYAVLQITSLTYGAAGVCNFNYIYPATTQ